MKKTWLKRSTNWFISHTFAIASVLLVLFFLFSFAFLFHLLFSLSLTLVIGIFYCLNCTSLLLHLIPTYLVSHLSLSSIIFSITTLIIGIFCCLNCVSLLLDLITYLANIFYNNYVINIFPRQLLWFIQVSLILCESVSLRKIIVWLKCVVIFFPK